jgi:hypothetical protein
LSDHKCQIHVAIGSDGDEPPNMLIMLHCHECGQIETTMPLVHLPALAAALTNLMEELDLENAPITKLTKTETLDLTLDQARARSIDRYKKGQH